MNGITLIPLKEDDRKQCILDNQEAILAIACYRQRFFVKYLGGISNNGYHNEVTDFRSFFISFEDGARLEIMNKPDMADADKCLNRTGYVHIAFSVGSKENVDRLTNKRKIDGFQVISGPRTTGDGYYESCVVAIEGNQIEITV